jgi:hypothetical protein
MVPPQSQYLFNYYNDPPCTADGEIWRALVGDAIAAKAAARCAGRERPDWARLRNGIKAPFRGRGA